MAATANRDVRVVFVISCYDIRPKRSMSRKFIHLCKYLQQNDMKFQIPSKISVDVDSIRLQLPVRYDDEDIPYDFPLRKGDMWVATVDIDTGRIKEWPTGKTGSVEMKVTDSGVYTLLDRNEETIAELQDYVPHGVVPGEYGDYVNLQIDETGRITNWPESPDLEAFFPEEN